MPTAGWSKLTAGWPWFRGAGRFPLPAYSEYMPPPRLVKKPYGEPYEPALDEGDPFGWPVSEYEEALELRPGMQKVARVLVREMVELAAGKPDETLADLLDDNPYWPAELANAGRLRHERYVLLAPLALSRTQCEQGEIRWTLFGNSEQGPARPFWRSFFTAPGVERPAGDAARFFSKLLRGAYDEPETDLDGLHRAGLRVLASEADGPRPSWVKALRLEPGSLRGVRHLLTFRPFAELPPAVRRAYLAGRLHLLPFPGSLVPWGARGYARLGRRLPLAEQVPLLLLIPEHDDEGGFRVPKSGWTEEPRPGEKPTKAATHRPSWPHRSPEPQGWAAARENRLAHTLFGTGSEDVGLYEKPSARNSQLWTADFRPLLDGPRSGKRLLHRAAKAFEAGGTFGYRFLYPPMQVGRHSVFWHRPLVAYRTPAGREHLLDDAPTGYLTAYPADAPEPARPAVELWPRFLNRELHAEAVRLLKDAPEEEPGQTLRSVRNLLETREWLGWDRLPHAFARRLIAAPKKQSLTAWLGHLPELSADPDRGRRLADELLRLTDPPPPAARRSKEPSLTFDRTARRSFEAAYWRTIAWLSAGGFDNRSTADPSLDDATVEARGTPPRGLDRLADALVARHRAAVREAGMEAAADVGELAFRWETECDYPWMGGWRASQTNPATERDVLVVIPGRDRSRAVILADHYDTAYCKDCYDPEQGGDKVRVSAPGADDNASATAALLLAAPVLLDLSRRGLLGCDVWLAHLTGEEFPAEGTGARELCRRLVEGDLRLRTAAGGLDLSDVRAKGLYVMDMIAHNRNANRDVFQISPGAGPAALWLAYQAHLANEAWNAGTVRWNRKPARRAAGRARRSADPARGPGVFRHLPLFGEVRPHGDPRSTFYNADGQEFSDAGVPAVLLMEDYDIDRAGYHDSRDTVALIDLDYGAALAAIAIEATARAATEEAG